MAEFKFGLEVVGLQPVQGALVEPDFADSRELWRLAGYLAAIAVDGHRPFGRRYFDRLDAAVRAYR